MTTIRTLSALVISGAALIGCSAFSGDSVPPSADSLAVRSFVVDRQEVERISYQGMDYVVQDITFEYDGGRRETRRYVLIGMRRVACNGDCQAALERGLANEDEGDDDY